MKQEIREQFINKRKNLSKEKKKKYDEKIINTLINTDIYKKAKTVFVYVSMEDEIDTSYLIDKMIEDQKIVLIPKIMKKPSMKSLRLFSRNDLIKDKFNTYSIKDSKEYKNPDLTICPGLSFDRKKNRLGFGGGFYDKYILENKSTYIGVFYSFQQGKFPVTDTDQKLDYIITEKEIF